MIRPKATSPRVSRSSRWYSIWWELDERRRRCGRRSAASPLPPLLSIACNRATGTPKEPMVLFAARPWSPAWKAGGWHRLSSGGAGQLGEALAALLVVAELVEARAGRRQQHGVAGGGRGRGVGNGPLERPAAHVGGAGRVEGGGDGIGGGADQIAAGHRPGGDRRRHPGIGAALERSAQDQVHAPLE